MVEKSSGIPSSGPLEPLTPVHGVTPVRKKDREERTVPDRKKKAPLKKPPAGKKEDIDKPAGDKDSKIDIRA